MKYLIRFKHNFSQHDLLTKSSHIALQVEELTSGTPSSRKMRIRYSQLSDRFHVIQSQSKSK